MAEKNVIGRVMAPERVWITPSDETGTFGIWREEREGNYSDGVRFVRTDIVSDLIAALDRLIGADEDDAEAINQAYNAIARAEGWG